jgi:hypothetical protein
MEMNYASRGLGATAAALGGSALGVALLNGGGGILGNLFGGNHGCSEDTPVTRYELGQQNEISALRSENELLKADKYTDQKIAEVYTVLNNKFDKVNCELRDIAVYQATNTATVGCLANQVNGLQAILGNITKTVVPNGAICPGWGDVTVTVTPTTTPTTGG